MMNRSTLVSLTAMTAVALAPTALAGYYANITGLGGSQSYGFIGFHGTTNQDDLFVWDSSISGSPVSGDMAHEARLGSY